MERRLNLASLMGLALLFLATTVAAADTNPVQEQESIPGAVPGKKFCARWTVEDRTVGQLWLSQKSYSYVPQGDSTESVDDYTIDHHEECFDLWYDPSGESNDVYSFLSSVGGDGLMHIPLYLESDLDFGGVSADSNSCVASFKPISFIRYASFFGSTYTIKNLCYIAKNESSPVGFFSSAIDMDFYSLKFENVYFKVENVSSFSTAPVGVVTGSLDHTEFGCSFRNISLKNVKIVAAQAGGLVGLIGEDTSPLIQNVSGENVEIFAAKGTIVSSMVAPDYSTYEEELKVHLGGLVGKASSGVSILNVGITGLKVHSDVESVLLTPENQEECNDNDCESSQDISGYIGGLVGSLLSEYSEVSVANTYTSGDISYKGGDYYAGFLAGVLSFGENAAYTIANNYHYGATDSQAANIAGLLELGGENVEASEWVYAYLGGRNYRNSIDGKIPFDETDFDSTSYIWDGANGGAIPADLMQKGAFAKALIEFKKEDLQDYDVSEWSRKDGVNNGMPVFATSELMPIYRIDFKAGIQLYENDSTIDKQIWLAAGATEDRDGLSLSVYTDYAGKIPDENWMEYALGLKEDGFYWEDFSDGRPFNLKSSTAFNSDKVLDLMKNVTVNVHYGFLRGDADAPSFVSVAEYMETVGGDFYFLGQPFETLSSTDVWDAFPELAVISSTADGTYYAYQRYTVQIRRCATQEGATQQVCSFSELSLNRSPFYASEYFSIAGLSDGGDIYVVYGQQSSTQSKGALFVADLQVGDNSQEPATIQVMAVDVNGEIVPTEATFDLPTGDADGLSSIVSYSDSIPFSPYLKVNYSSDIWNEVSGVVALVVVGGNWSEGSSDSRRSISDAVEILASVDTSGSSLLQRHPLLQDTLTELGSVEEIIAEMSQYSLTAFKYARYVRLSADGTLNLENLFRAIAPYRRHAEDNPFFIGFAPIHTEIMYRISFDVNTADAFNLFITDEGLSEDFSLTKDFSVNTESEIFFEEFPFYRTDACFTGGWSTSPELELDSSYSFEEKMIYSIWSFGNDSIRTQLPSLVEEQEDGAMALNLYAVWDPSGDFCESRGNRLIAHKAEDSHGEIRLQQVWRGDTLVHLPTNINEGNYNGSYGFLIPWAGQNFTLNVVAAPYPGYELADSITFKYLDMSPEDKTETETTKKLKDGATIVITPEMYDNMELSANFVLKTYNLTFETGMENVFYGETPVLKETYKLRNEEDSIDFPMLVYTSDRCVEGWTARPEFEDEEPVPEDIECEGDPACEQRENERWWVFKAFNFELSEMLVWDNANIEEYSVYAKWTDAATCVNRLGYGQATLVAENGSIELEEIMESEDGEPIVQVHGFAEDSTMLLPSGKENSVYVVHAVPETGFVLDSIVMTLEGETFVYHEGDTLSGDISKAVFQAYFAIDNSTPVEFTRAKLLQSGNAVRFDFATTEFNASGAELRIVIENDVGDSVVDTTIAISETPFTDSWEHFPLPAGNYLLTATLSNGRGSALFEQDFEIKAKFASVKDGWRMVALSNMVVDSSMLADDDVRIYWWDDAKDYGYFWRYQRLTNERDIQPLTGYWYSSMEGRPLVTRKDVKQPSTAVVWNMDSVYTGWNMVANPYGWYVDLYGENPNEKKTATEESKVEFYSWNDSLGDYEPVDVVGPYEAVWAKVKGPSRWKLPSKPAFVSTVDENGNDSLMKPLKKTVELASGGKGWAIRAVLRDAKGKRDSWNFMGVSESGWASEEPPSGMGDHVNLSIKDGKKSLAKSFKKAAGDSYEWTVSLEASGDRTGYLHFEGIDALRASGLKVFVTVDGITTQMAERDTLKVSIGSMAKTAVVRVAPSARTVVAQKLNGLRAFQAGNSLQVGFQVSESLAGVRAYVEILDMKGKVLSSVSGTAVSGSNVMTLQTPKSGLYMVRVRVGSKQAAGSVAIK